MAAEEEEEEDDIGEMIGGWGGGMRDCKAAGYFFRESGIGV